MDRDTRIKVVFSERESFPALFVARVIRHVDLVVHEVEREDFEAALHALRGLPDVTRDALRYRLEKHPATAFYIRSNYRGSVVIAGVVGAVAKWILDKTLGETVKQAWKKSRLHRRLKKLLSWRSRTKAKRIQKKIQATKADLWPEGKAEISVKLVKDEVLINVRLKIGNLAPTYGQLEQGGRTRTAFAPRKSGKGRTRDLTRVPVTPSRGRAGDLPLDNEFM